MYCKCAGMETLLKVFFTNAPEFSPKTRDKELEYNGVRHTLFVAGKKICKTLLAFYRHTSCCTQSKVAHMAIRNRHETLSTEANKLQISVLTWDVCSNRTWIIHVRIDSHEGDEFPA